MEEYMYCTRGFHMDLLTIILHCICKGKMYVCLLTQSSWFIVMVHYFLHSFLQESLLDRQDFLQWLLDLLDKSKNADDLLLKFLIPLLLRVKYHVHFVLKAYNCVNYTCTSSNL